MVAEVYAGTGLEAARIAGEHPEMDRVAGRLRQLVKAEAARHRDSGAFGDSVIVQRARGRRGVQDRLVTATDPLAAVKEFGHAIRREKGGPPVAIVHGMFTMARAIRKLPEVRGD